MIDLPMEIPSDFLRPLTLAWTTKFEAARRTRQPWKDMADECRMFYNRSAAAMWDPAYARKFWKNVKPPKFRITLNLAYEYVAVMSPFLLWDAPHRQVNPKRGSTIPPEILGGEESPMWQAYQQEQQQAEAVDKTLAWFLQDWLNYTSWEQKSGGLVGHSELSTIDALLTGRGCLWTRPYSMPNSDKVLTGAFYEPPERMLIDPDFPSLDGAKWIALEHIENYQDVENRFRLPPGSLKGKATLESAWGYGANQTQADASAQRTSGQANDLMKWYEVWSKGGCGCANTGMYEPVRNFLDQVAGQFVYVAVAPSVPYPLNLPVDGLRDGMNVDEVKQRLAWPIKLFADDDRWPCESLDFYPNTDIADPSAAWPIPPLAPAMGEIKFLNFIVPWLANRIWSSSRDFWAVAGPHYEHYLKYLEEGADQTVIPTPVTVDDIQKAITVLQQPETRADMWRIVEIVEQLFRRRTGMNDTLYGMNEQGTQSRTAQDAMVKKEATGARPQYMQKKVVSWQGRVAASEAMVTRAYVTGKDVVGRYGQVGAQLWDQFVATADVEAIARQMSYSIDAASIRRPNRDRDIENYMTGMQYWLSVMQEYATQTGNYEPINGLISKWGELHDMDVSALMLPPPPPNQGAELEQQQMQMEMAKTQAELQGKQIDIEGKQMDVQNKALLGQMDLKQEMAKMAIDQLRGIQDLRQDAAKGRLDIQQTKAMNRIKAQQAKKAKTNGSAK